MSIGPFSTVGWMSLFATAILLSACSDGLSCAVSDQAKIVDELRADNQTLYLVYRVTGWADKVEFYELYATPPSFDICGHSKDKPLDVKDVYLNEGLMVKDVIVRSVELEIRYTLQPDEGVKPGQTAKLVRE